MTPALVARWEDALESARRTGFEVVPARELALPERAALLCALWNETFASHWGYCPLSPDLTALFVRDGDPSLDTTVLSFSAGEPVGFCFVSPDDLSHAAFERGRDPRPGERTNMLGIGVRRAARGRGLNYAMAAYAYLELVRQGWTHVSYTLVLDDNWPSRRTGEGLGASLCANYVAYRRDLRGR